MHDHASRYQEVLNAHDRQAVVAKAALRRRLGIMLTAIIITIVVIPAALTIRDMRRMAAQVESYRNMTALATSLSMYTQDYDDHLPPMHSIAEVREILAPSYRNFDSLWYTPRLHIPLAVNPSLSGRFLKDIPVPKKTIALWDTRVYRGYRIVTFAKGSVRSVAEPEWSQLRAVSGIKQDAPVPHEPWW